MHCTRDEGDVWRGGAVSAEWERQVQCCGELHRLDGASEFLSSQPDGGLVQLLYVTIIRAHHYSFDTIASFEAARCVSTRAAGIALHEHPIKVLQALARSRFMWRGLSWGDGRPVSRRQQTGRAK
jgi:hypothetical protein